MVFIRYLLGEFNLSSNKSFKPLAMLARTPSTPRLIALGFAMFAQTVLHAERRLTGRYVLRSGKKNAIAAGLGSK